MQKTCVLSACALVLLGWFGSSAVAGIVSVTRLGTSTNDPPVVSAHGLAEDATSFVDRIHEYNRVPAFLVGGDYIRVANDDRNVSDYGLRITLDASASLCLIIDNRIDVETNMPWVADDGYMDTGVDCGVDELATDVIDNWGSVWVRTVGAGTVVTGAQNQGGTNNYGVVLAADMGLLPDVAGHAPQRTIRTSAWNYLLLLNPRGCTGGGTSFMARNWAEPHDIAAENPKAGTQWNDIDFGGASPSSGWNFGGLLPIPTWLSNEFVMDTFGRSVSRDAPPFPDGIGADGKDDGHSIDFQNIAVWLTDYVVPNVAGTSAIPDDNVVGIATTYVRNLTGAPLSVQICQGSDDSMLTAINNQLVNRVEACRSSGDCQELYDVILPPGVSQIRAQVFEGGNEWNFRMALYDPQTGTPLVDGNGRIEFLGTGAGDATVISQPAYNLKRSIARSNDFNCSDPEPATVVLRGEAAAGFEGRVRVTITEEIISADGAEILIDNVSHGGTVTDIYEILRACDEVIEDFPFVTIVGTDLGWDSDGDGQTDATSYAVSHGDVGGDGCRDFESASTTGGDIWNECDSFLYQYVRTPNDFDISCEIIVWGHSTNAGRWGKAGLMARLTLDNASRYGMIQTHMPDLGDAPRYGGRRNHSGAPDTDCGSCFEVATSQIGSRPRFLRLTRRGNVISGWVSNRGGLTCGGDLDPCQDSNWILVHSEAWPRQFAGDITPNPGGLYVGFANSEHYSEGGALQTFRYELLRHKDRVPRRIGKKITWENVRRADVSSGLRYDVGLATAGSVTLGRYAIEGELKASLRDSVQFPSRLPTGEICNHADIGSPNALSDFRHFGDGTYGIAGIGSDIWDAGDHFHFGHCEQEGDFVATARVYDTEMIPANARWGRYGIMARYSCDQNAKYSLACKNYRGEDPLLGGLHSLPGQDQDRHQSRRDHLRDETTRDHQIVPAAHIDHTDHAQALRGWIRLVRRGRYFYTLFANDNNGDPGPWHIAGGDTHPRDAPETMLVGFIAGSHDSGRAAGNIPLTVWFDEWSVLPYTPPDLGGVPVGRIAEYDYARERDGDPPAGAVVVDGGNLAFGPIVTGGRLRVAQDGVVWDANAVYYPIEGVSLGNEGFEVELDAFYDKRETGGINPADGMCIVAFEGADRADYVGFVGNTGFAMGYENADHNQIDPAHEQYLGKRRKSWAVEIDCWDGGIGSNDPPGHGAGGRGADDDHRYHVGININQCVQSAQNNVEYGAAVPDFYNSEAGMHLRIQYLPASDAEAQVDVYVDDNDDAPDRGESKVLSAVVPKLDEDITVGITAGTGAPATFEIDNLSIARLCVETRDQVEITGDAIAEVGSNAALAATFTGNEGAVSYAWSITAGDARILGRHDNPAVIVQCDADGMVRVRLEAGDAKCGNILADTFELECGSSFTPMVPFDSNLDGGVDLSDGIRLLTHLFLARQAMPCEGPYNEGSNLETLDWNGDAGVDLADAVGCFSHLFLGGPEHDRGKVCHPFGRCDGLASGDPGTCDL